MAYPDPATPKSYPVDKISSIDSLGLDNFMVGKYVKVKYVFPTLGGKSDANNDAGCQCLAFGTDGHALNFYIVGFKEAKDWIHTVDAKIEEGLKNGTLMLNENRELKKMSKEAIRKEAVNISDPVTKALDVFLKSVGGSLKDRYSTIDEVGEDVNRLYQAWVQGIQQNYERVHQQIASSPSNYGIEIVGNESAGDFVNENTMGAVDENKDPFNDGSDAPPPDDQIQDVFNDTDTGAVTPQ